MHIVFSGQHLQRLLLLLAIGASIVYVYAHPDLLEPTVNFLQGLNLM